MGMVDGLSQEWREWALMFKNDNHGITGDDITHLKTHHSVMKTAEFDGNTLKLKSSLEMTINNLYSIIPYVLPSNSVIQRNYQRRCVSMLRKQMDEAGFAENRT